MVDDEDLTTQKAILSAIQESRDEEERVAEEERRRTSVLASLPTPTPVSTPSTHGSNTADTLTSSQTATPSKEGATQFAGARRRDFAGAIIFHEYPLAMADHIKFRKFISNLQPLFKMVTRNATKSDILKIHETAIERFKKLLAANTGRITITTDMRTSRKKK
ncbi:zinc finger BED domain-containing protein RICESLEEPER 2-like [Senna tora]|uniref:Zinc finger BED domain-containing protein RICESLEEPER 2-like n=1 Tax=Senna tora TaxID=362788 RepID=A0A834SC18_9FABA|nr:zinc finger BED domain-containing protein RICESLEEPER 2-like [Senna tora]